MDLGSQQGAEKNALETEKLLLEKQLLQRQLSKQGVVLSWVPAITVPLLGVIVALLVGFLQWHQGADNQTNERFDKALSRLASQRPEERITGIFGLDLFLGESNELLQKQALVFLVNALSLEADERVRGAMLEVLADLPTGRPSQEALNAGLRVAIERNRSLANLAAREWHGRILKQKKQTLAKFNMPWLDLNGIGDEIPAHTLAALSTERYLSLLDAEHGPFEMLDPAQEVPLTGLMEAIQTLIARGATSTDFKGIYCDACKFNAGKSLDGADFKGASLRYADFAHMSLRRTSFVGASLDGANFFDADLTGADLSVFSDYEVFTGRVFSFPKFECAKLGGADLSGQPLVSFLKRFNTYSLSPYQIALPSMTSVQLDGSTKLDNFSIIIELGITDDYLKVHKVAPEAKFLMETRSSPTIHNPLTNGSEMSADFARSPGSTDKYKWTFAAAAWVLGNKDDLKSLANEAFMLRGHIDQPALRVLPLYSQFIDAVSSLSIPNSTLGKLAQERSDKSAERWAEIKNSLSCNSKEGPFDLLVEIPG